MLVVYKDMGWKRQRRLKGLMHFPRMMYCAGSGVMSENLEGNQQFEGEMKGEKVAINISTVAMNLF